MPAAIDNNSKNDIDIDTYFNRISYAGPRTPTLDTLQALHLRHTESIPFENLNPWLGQPVPLDLNSLQQKFMRDGRGGYCFEHNLLFGVVLRTLGFHVVNLAARVLWNQPAGAMPARSHMLLRVDINGEPYIADVGFGGQTLTGPLRLEPGTEQATPHEPFRLHPLGDSLLLEAKIRDHWKSLYRFDLVEQYLPDYEVSNWYLSNHPSSHFVTSLIASRTAPERRYALRNNELAVHHLHGLTERHALQTAVALREALTNDLRITLPDTPELDAALWRLIVR